MTEEEVANFLESLMADRTLDAAIAVDAVRLVYLAPTSAALTHVVRTLEERPDLALSAAVGLARAGDPTVIPELQRILLNAAAAPEARAGAALALGQFHDPRVESSLLLALRTPGQEPVVLTRLAASLGRLRSTDAVGDLCRLLASDSPDVRYSALDALGAIRAIEAQAAIDALLEDAGVTGKGMHIDEKAARVSRLLAASGALIDDCLDYCAMGDSGEWGMFRRLVLKTRYQLPHGLARRLETSQFMSEASSRGLCFNYLGSR
jgi:hypothetical protein